jgi:hypothetical protein
MSVEGRIGNETEPVNTASRHPSDDVKELIDLSNILRDLVGRSGSLLTNHCIRRNDYSVMSPPGFYSFPSPRCVIFSFTKIPLCHAVG